jgi:hypothetical protein
LNDDEEEAVDKFRFGGTPLQEFLK